MALIVLRRARADVPEAVQEAAHAARPRLDARHAERATAAGPASIATTTSSWLTDVPFADHNAMIDPSTADITGRVLECLSHFDGFDRRRHPVVRRALDVPARAADADGSWFGRWGVNYIYGTWQVLRGLRCIGEDIDAPYVRRAARWLHEHQNPDGGWGESIASYDDAAKRGVGPSTPSQTAWAIMGLIAGGRRPTARAVRPGRRAICSTARTPKGPGGRSSWTGTGFPGVFYLNYDYYRHYFPLMALAQYARARQLPLGALE